MNAKCVRDSHGKRSHDSRHVEDHCDSDSEHKELHEPCDLASKKKENRDYSDDPEEQRPEKGLQVCHKPRGAERDRGGRGKQVRWHRYSGCGERGVRGFGAEGAAIMTTARVAWSPH